MDSKWKKKKKLEGLNCVVESGWKNSLIYCGRATDWGKGPMKEDLL